MKIIKNFASWIFRLSNYAGWALFSKLKEINPDKINRILVVNLGYIGDLLATTPLIRVLSENGKGVDILLRKDMESLFKDNKYVNKIINFSDYFKLKDIKAKYDLAILIHPNNDEMVKALRRLNLPIIADVPHKFSDLKYSCLISRMKKPYFKEKKHKVLQNLDFAEMLGIRIKEINQNNNPMVLNLTANEIKRTKKKFKLEEKYVVLSPGSRKMGMKSQAEHMISPDKFSRIAEHLIQRYNKRIVLVGSEKDIEICNRIYESIKYKRKVINLSGKTNIRELAAILRESDLLFGVDSGVIHLAASQNCKIIDIINKRFEKIWHPWIEHDKYRILSVKGRLNSVDIEDIKRNIDSLI